MNYKKRRVKVGITPYTMAKELGIDYDKYLLIEKGKIALEDGLLDKFLETIDNAKMVNINSKQEANNIKELAKEGKLRELMNKRNYNGMQLAEATGISSSEISRIMNYDGKKKCPSDDVFRKLYDFLKEPYNHNVEETRVIKKGVRQQIGANTFNEKEKAKYEELMDKHNISRIDIANEFGVSVSTINNLFSPKSIGSATTKAKFEEYMKQFEEVETPVETPQETETPEVQIIEETPEVIEIPEIVEDQVEDTCEVCKDEFDKTFIDLIHENYELKEKLNKAERQIRLYEKLIERL